MPYPQNSFSISPQRTSDASASVIEKQDDELTRTDTRRSLVERLPDTARNHFIAMAGEFVGTLLFLFFALSGTQTANSVNTSSGLTLQEAGSNPQQLLYISLCFGFSLAVNAWTFYRISGGLFNPAVTLGLCLIGAVDWVRGALLFVTQIVAGMAAAGLVDCLFPGPLNVGTTLSGGTSTVQGLFIEVFLTAQLVFTIFMLAAEKHKGTFMAPVGIGLSLFIAELTGVHYTGGSLNPARSFGPCVATLSFPSIHWIYWVGPLLGAVLAAGLFYLFKYLDYETANPGQDAAEEERKEKESKSRTGMYKRKDSIFDTVSALSANARIWTGETAFEAEKECASCSKHRESIARRKSSSTPMQRAAGLPQPILPPIESNLVELGNGEGAGQLERPARPVLATRNDFSGHGNQPQSIGDTMLRARGQLGSLNGQGRPIQRFARSDSSGV